MSMSELKPCPFCESTELSVTSNGGESFFLECQGCGASGPVGIRWTMGDGWNERPIEEALSAAVEEENKKLRGLLQWFLDRCDKGEIRSQRTYLAFKKALEEAV